MNVNKNNVLKTLFKVYDIYFIREKAVKQIVPESNTTVT